MFTGADAEHVAADLPPDAAAVLRRLAEQHAILSQAFPWGTTPSLLMVLDRTAGGEVRNQSTTLGHRIWPIDALVEVLEACAVVVKAPEQRRYVGVAVYVELASILDVRDDTMKPYRGFLGSLADGTLVDAGTYGGDEDSWFSAQVPDAMALPPDAVRAALIPICRVFAPAPLPPGHPLRSPRP